MNMMYKTQYNFVRSKGESNDMPSLTIPGQTIPIADMLRRAVNGIPFQLDSRQEYTGDTEPLPQLKDLSDITRVEEHIAGLVDKVKAAVEEKKLAAIKAAQPPSKAENKSDNPAAGSEGRSDGEGA